MKTYLQIIFKENVLIDENMNLKLTDFGFALKLDPDENLRALCGTPAYMAPEMLRCACDASSEGYSFPADMWSCGVRFNIFWKSSLSLRYF